MTSERPRRTVRAPTKHQNDQAVETTTQTELSSISKKRKVARQKLRGDDPDSLDFLLKNPKSPLVSLEFSTLINEQTWTALSPDGRALLSTMLPPTRAPSLSIRSALGPLHPGLRCHTLDDKEAEPVAFAPEPEPSLFTDAFFEAAAKTFQDHLYSGWLTPAHQALVQEYTENIKSGVSHAPWKDDIWRAEHPGLDLNASSDDGLAGEASSLSLVDLAKHSVVRVGDILAYRRCFSQLNITVLKDVLIRHIHPSSHSLTVLVAPSITTHLPIEYLRNSEISYDLSESRGEACAREMTITNPSQLENALLDIDSRVERANRPNGNAWKCFGVWRWRDETIPLSTYAMDPAGATRGGRDYRGTLFYLRGCFYDDQ